MRRGSSTARSPPRRGSSTALFLRDADLQRSDSRRVGHADDIADVVSFLASPDSRWVTGQRIEASGGANL